MDNFIAYGEILEEAINNMEKVISICQEMNLSLSNESFHMLLIEDTVIGHHIFPSCIRVEPMKIEIIGKLPVPTFQKGK